MAIPCRRPDQNADTVLPAIATAAAPSYTEGEAVPLSVSLNGTLRTTAGSGGGSGDASLAEQQSQTALLTTIDADTSNISTKIDTLAGAVTAAKVQVDVVSAPTTAVTGTFWQATQPVSAASLPLPTGAATAAKQPALGTAGTASADVITVQGIASMTALKVDGSAVTQPVSGTFWQATQPVSLASVPSHAVTNAGTFATQAAQSGTWNITNVSGTVSLPTGAATAAKQPALGTAGTASTDVITVQGIAAMTALKVDGSSVTQPVSAASLPLPTGASTAAKQPALGTAGTASADVITVQGIASMTAIKVDGSAVTQPVSGTFWQATQPVSLASVPSHAVTNAGTFAVQAAQSGTWTVQPGNTQNTTAWLVTQVPATSGGLLVFRSLDLDETEEEVKGSAGQVYGVWFTNTATTTRWLKFYNATAANVTVGTTTPIITLGLPGNTSDDIAGVLMGGEHGIAFGTAITAAVTTGFADNDTGAPGANDVIINIFYK